VVDDLPPAGRILRDEGEPVDPRAEREPGFDHLLEIVGGRRVDAVGHGEVGDRVGDRASVRRTVRERRHRRSGEPSERLDRVRRQMDDLAGKPAERREADVEGTDTGRDLGDSADRDVVDVRPKRVQDRHVCRDAGRRGGVVSQPMSRDVCFRFRHEDYERRLSHPPSLARHADPGHL